MNLVQNYSDHFGNSQYFLLQKTGYGNGCRSLPPALTRARLMPSGHHTSGINTLPRKGFSSHFVPWLYAPILKLEHGPSCWEDKYIWRYLCIFGTFSSVAVR